MSNITKLADLGDRDAFVELRERIEQLESQDNRGYGICLEFYKRILAQADLREQEAFQAGLDAQGNEK